MSPLFKPQTNPGIVKSDEATPKITSLYLTENILFIDVSSVPSFIVATIGPKINFTSLINSGEFLVDGNTLRLRAFDLPDFLARFLASIL